MKTDDSAGCTPPPPLGVKRSSSEACPFAMDSPGNKLSPHPPQISPIMSSSSSSSSSPPLPSHHFCNEFLHNFPQNFRLHQGSPHHHHHLPAANSCWEFPDSAQGSSGYAQVPFPLLQLRNIFLNAAISQLTAPPAPGLLDSYQNFSLSSSPPSSATYQFFLPQFPTLSTVASPSSTFHPYIPLGHYGRVFREPVVQPVASTKPAPPPPLPALPQQQQQQQRQQPLIMSTRSHFHFQSLPFSTTTGHSTMQPMSSSSSLSPAMNYVKACQTFTHLLSQDRQLSQPPPPPHLPPFRSQPPFGVENPSKIFMSSPAHRTSSPERSPAQLSTPGSPFCRPNLSNSSSTLQQLQRSLSSNQTSPIETFSGLELRRSSSFEPFQRKDIHQLIDSVSLRLVGNSGGGYKKQNLAAATPSLLYCLVCGDRASGRHYGVLSCDGCRGFFKRSVRRNMRYTCKAANRCVVDAARRNQCQACRFGKCLAVKMNRDAVQHERTPRALIYAYTDAIKNLEPNSSDAAASAHCHSDTATETPSDRRRLKRKRAACPIDVQNEDTDQSNVSRRRQSNSLGDMGNVKDTYSEVTQDNVCPFKSLKTEPSSLSGFASATSCYDDDDDSSDDVKSRRQSKSSHRCHRKNLGSSPVPVVHRHQPGKYYRPFLGDDLQRSPTRSATSTVEAAKAAAARAVSAASNNGSAADALSVDSKTDQDQMKPPDHDLSGNDCILCHSTRGGFDHHHQQQHIPTLSVAATSFHVRVPPCRECRHACHCLSSSLTRWLNMNEKVNGIRHFENMAAKVLLYSVAWVKSLSSFSSLESADQAQLLEASWPQLLVLGYAQWCPFYIRQALEDSRFKDSCADDDDDDDATEVAAASLDVMDSLVAMAINPTEHACLKALAVFRCSGSRNLRDPGRVSTIRDQVISSLREHVELCSREREAQVRLNRLLKVSKGLEAIGPRVVQNLFLKKEDDDRKTLPK